MSDGFRSKGARVMLMEKIADYAIRERSSKLPKEVIHHAKRAVIDWYASLLPGSRVAPAVQLEQALADEIDRGRARLASGRRATLRAAALINGSASHAVEFDDIWRNAGTVGCFGAAASAATLLGCNREQFMNALGTVGTFAAGLQQAFRSEAMSKPMHAAHAAESGVLAAMAAAKGATGVHDILEGEVGFGAAMSVKPDWERA